MKQQNIRLVQLGGLAKSRSRLRVVAHEAYLLPLGRGVIPDPLLAVESELPDVCMTIQYFGHCFDPDFFTSAEAVLIEDLEDIHVDGGIKAGGRYNPWD